MESGIDSKESIPARLFSLEGRYANPIPTRFLAPVDCSKIPALVVLLIAGSGIAGTDLCFCLAL